MNTSILSPFPATPAPEQPAQPRPVKGSKPAAGVRETMGNEGVQEPESTGDSDKADAFAEMLAAMMSVSTPVETPAAEVTTAGVESVSIIADIPRDGAGSPLFGSSFTTPVAAGASTTTTTSATAVTAAGFEAGGDALPGQMVQESVSSTPMADATPVSDAAAAEIAQLGGESAEGDSTAALDENLQALADDVGESVTAEVEPVADGYEEAELPVTQVTELVVPETSEAPRPNEVPADPALQNQTAGEDPAVATASKPVESSSAADKTKNVSAPVENVQAKAAPVDQPAEPAVAETPAPQTEVEPVVVEQPVAAAEPFTTPEQPFEQPEVESRERPERPEATSSAPRKSAAPTSRTSEESIDVGRVSESSPETVVTAVESTPAATLKKDFAREQPVVPAAADENIVAPVVSVDAMAATTAGEAVGGPAASAVAGFSDAGAASTPAHVSQQVLQALAAYEADLPQGGSRSFELLLDPPELGRLLVQMSRTSKGVDVRIAAENETVQSILETRGAELQQSLQLSGFDLGAFGGSGQGGTQDSGQEWVNAPTLQSFATGSSPTRASVTPSTGKSAVDVVV